MVTQKVAVSCYGATCAKNVTATSRLVNDNNASASVSLVDLPNNTIFLSEFSTSVKQEMVNEDSMNHVSEGRMHFPG